MQCINGTVFLTKQTSKIRSTFSYFYFDLSSHINKIIVLFLPWSSLKAFRSPSECFRKKSSLKPEKGRPYHNKQRLPNNNNKQRGKYLSESEEYIYIFSKESSGLKKSGGKVLFFCNCQLLQHTKHKK